MLRHVGIRRTGLISAKGWAFRRRAELTKIYFPVDRGEEACPGNHLALGWLMIGFDAGEGLIGYYDDIMFGEEDQVPNPTAVEPESKLATTWGSLRN